MMKRRSSAHISPSAHYTGHVWQIHGLSYPPLSTRGGAWAHKLLIPFNAIGLRMGMSLDQALLARHRIIDQRLTEFLGQHGHAQVIEIACGLSPRGHRFVQAHPDIDYWEADLPNMAQLKNSIINRSGWQNKRHQVLSVDILADDKDPQSLQCLMSQLDQKRPVVVITEGLLNYFPLEVAENFWQRLALQLRQFDQGIYLTDLVTDLITGWRRFFAKIGFRIVARLTRGSFTPHFSSVESLERQFTQCGFEKVRPFFPFSAIGDSQSKLICVVESRVGYTDKSN